MRTPLLLQTSARRDEKPVVPIAGLTAKWTEFLIRAGLPVHEIVDQVTQLMPQSHRSEWLRAWPAVSGSRPASARLPQVRVLKYGGGFHLSDIWHLPDLTTSKCNEGSARNWARYFTSTFIRIHG